jgi:hypothetical protein
MTAHRDKFELTPLQFQAVLATLDKKQMLAILEVGISRLDLKEILKKLYVSGDYVKRNNMEIHVKKHHHIGPRYE